MIIIAVLHVVFSSVMGFILSALAGKMTPLVAVISLLSGTVFAILAGRSFCGNSFGKIKKASLPDKAIFGFIIGFVFLQSLFLFYPAQESLRTQLPNNLGDLPMHISYIKHISSGAEFPPVNPIFSNDLLRYPFGLHVYNALWDCLGVGLGANLFVSTFVLLLIGAILLYWWKGIWALGAAFLNGGWAAFYVLSTGRFFDLQNSLVWKNFTVSLFLTQRGFLIAIPICVFLFKTVGDYLTGIKKLQKKNLLVIGLLWGLLPFFHTHSFFVFSLVVGSWMVIHFLKKTDRAKVVDFCKWSLGAAIAIGTPIMLFLTDFFKRSSLIHWKPGWMTGKSGFWFFWYREAGLWFALACLVFLLAAVSLLFRLGKKRRSGLPAPVLEWKLFVLFAFFGVFHFILMAVWDWDNIKVFFWIQLLLVVYGTDMLRQTGIVIAKRSGKFRSWLSRSGVKTGMKTVLGTCLFLTGVVSLICAQQSTQNVDIYSQKEIRVLQVLTRDIGKDKIFLAEPTYNNPLGYLGFALAAGYDGHLFSHGIDYLPVMKLVKDFYSGNGDYREIAAKLGVDYVLYGPKEKAKFSELPLRWRTELTNLSPIEGYELYCLEPLGKP